MSHREAGLTIRDAVEADARAIAGIYNHYVRESIATFQEQEVGPEQIAERIARTRAIPLPWLIAEDAGSLAGYAYASPWQARSAYRFTVEISVYLTPSRMGRGVGSRLYERLLPALRDQGIHAVLGGISLPNVASVALHEKFGLKKVAHLEQVGFKLGRWVDVGYWQRIL